MPRVLVAGTFDRLHAGHAALLDAAIAAAAAPGAGGAVEVWVTSDAMASSKAAAARVALRSAAERRAHVAALFASRAGGVTDAVPLAVRCTVHELDDAVGPAADAADGTVLVCSEETLPGAARINAARAAAARAPLHLIVVPVLRGADGEKLSSTALRALEAAAAAGGAAAPPPPPAAAP